MFVYIHVPFCPSHCIYCDFYVVLEKSAKADNVGQTTYRAAYLAALKREFSLRLSGGEQSLSPIQSIYIGGGTPSLLTAGDYQDLLETLTRYSPLAEDAELTLEANPLAMADDPAAYRRVGFNRISIGIQSLDDGELKKLSRAHTAQEAVDFVKQVQQAGFENVSIDLMYGIPGQTQASWQTTLEKTLALDIQHVSMYGLKVEPSTVLATLLDHPRAKAAYALPEDEETVALYFQALDALEQGGFDLYEFSNLSRGPLLQSRHNLNYWYNTPYYAFGVSAHGYLPAAAMPIAFQLPEKKPLLQESMPQETVSANAGRTIQDMIRYETVRDLKTYLENPLAGKLTRCPLQEQLENALIFGLRKTEGVHLEVLESQYGVDFEAKYGSVFHHYSALGLMARDGNRLYLTREAIPVSNSILADFLQEI